MLQVLSPLWPPDDRWVQDVQELEELHLHPGGASQTLRQTGLFFHQIHFKHGTVLCIVGATCIFAAFLERHFGLQRQHDGAGARL